MSTAYTPELDVSQTLSAEYANFYQSMIGILRWSIECGRIDITTEVSKLAAHMVMPRIGHFEAALRIIGYIKRKHNSRLVFDPTYPKINHTVFKEDADWEPFYGNVKEPISPNAPKPRGKEVVIRLFVDSDHAGDKLTRRSRSGHIFFVNMAPIGWYSKKQGSIESATFGSEFASLKTAAEANRGLRYRLRMMGIPIDGPSYTFVDNMSVVYNSTTPESTLKKKSNAIAYHFVRESVSMGEMIIGFIPTEHNVADILTKVLPGGEKRDTLIQRILWDIT